MSAVGSLGPRRRCAVTGANGYVGSRIARYLGANGWDVRELRHGSAAGADTRIVGYELEQGIEADDLAGVDVLIHCAWDFRPRNWGRLVDVNVRGAAKLFAAATRAGVGTIVAVSTMSAFPGCASLYGRAKLAVEAEATKVGAVVVRPGLVFGRRPGGMLGALQQAVRASRMVPLVAGRQRLFLAHEDDLGRLMLRLGETPPPKIAEPIVAASEHDVSFREILRVIGAANGRAPVLVPIPWRLVWGGLKIAEVARLSVRFRSDSVVSLVTQDPAPSFDGLRAVGIRFRDFNLETLTSE